MINRVDLSGWWYVKFDEEDQGGGQGWAARIPPDCLKINIPSCWNEVFPEYTYYDGTAWFYKEVRLPDDHSLSRTMLCFEAVNYRCEAFINGQSVGSHEGGFTIFEFDVTRFLRPGEINLIALRVNARLDEWTLPPSGVDWFNYGGIYRPVYFKRTGPAWVEDYTIKTRMNGEVQVSALCACSGVGEHYQLVLEIQDQIGQQIAQQTLYLRLTPCEAHPVNFTIRIEDPQLWQLGNAYLYSLALKLLNQDGTASDKIENRFGIREFGIQGRKLLINGEEVRLVGCSKHDEYPLSGRAVSREQLVKDYDLLRQMSANFVRLAHYPHSQLEHDLLDELGIVAISEIPMVFLREPQMTSNETLAKSKRMLEEMINAEKNTTSIMFWSLFIECETNLPSTRTFVKEIVDATKALDGTRFVVTASDRPLEDVTYEYFDVIGINYWEGWYGGSSIEEGKKFLSQMAERYPDKPALITSHGYEGFRGMRSYIEKTPWSEEAQGDYLTQIADAYLSYQNIAGEIVWTFADFRVWNWRDISEPGQNFTYLARPALVNHKGMVDFFRQPKSTYYRMKEKFAEWQELVMPPAAVLGENLRVRLFTNRQVLGAAAAYDFIDIVQTLLLEKETINVIFATGASQEQLLASLVRNKMFVDWRRINGFHLDEYVGIGLDNHSGFVRFLQDRLTGLVPFRSFSSLNGLAKDPEVESRRYAELLQQTEVDLACIGIGENGHLAFNDPPVANFEDPFLVKVIDLEETCREQQFREGAFPTIESVPRQAFTLTIPAIMRARRILCAVPGAVKEVPVWKTLHAPISTACPATILRQHPDVTLYLDSESAHLTGLEKK